MQHSREGSKTGSGFCPMPRVQRLCWAGGPLYLMSVGGPFRIVSHQSMSKILVVAAALTISLVGHAVAQETAHRHPKHSRHHVQPEPSFPEPQSGPPAQAPDVYSTPAGGNPVHYGQTSGFYAGR